MHNGFLRGAGLELGAILEAVSLMPGLPIWLAGHSLGGAYAVCTVLLMHTRDHRDSDAFKRLQGI